MIYLLGSTGMLGHVVQRWFEQQDIPICIVQEKFEDINQIKNFTKELSINDIVINCAGVIRHRLNRDFNKWKIPALLINSILPHILADKVYTIHVSTDSIFEGKGNKGNYDETSIPDGTDFYSRTKIIGEPIESSNCLIIRASVVGPELNNHFGLFDWIRTTKSRILPGYVNFYWNGLTTLELAKQIEKLLFERRKGILNLHSDCISKYQLLCLINDIWNLNKIIKPVKLDEPINKCLTSKFKLSIKPIDEQLYELREYY